MLKIYFTIIINLHLTSKLATDLLKAQCVSFAARARLLKTITKA